MRPLWGAVTVNMRQEAAIDDLTEETKSFRQFIPQPKHNVSERLLDKFPLLGRADEPDEILCNIV